MEEKIAKRGWVKNAAIIFLSVMLVLTFFSNTILNHSLPEAASVAVVNGTIESKIRVSGTVSARENYDVILDEGHKIDSVQVRVGQTVNAGDVLFTLSAGDSTELEAAKDRLYDLELSYKKMLLNSSQSDYAQENRDIALARTALENAEAKLSLLEPVSSEELSAAKEKLDSINYEVKQHERNVSAAQTGVQYSTEGAGSNGPDLSSAIRAVSAAEEALRLAKNDLAAATLNYKTNYDIFEGLAKIEILNVAGVQEWNDANYKGMIPYYREMLKDTDLLNTRINALLADGAPIPLEDDIKNRINNYFSSIGIASPTPENVTDFAKALALAYNKISSAEEKKAEAESAYSDAQANYNSLRNEITYDPGVDYEGKPHSYWVKTLAEAEASLATARDIQTSYQESYDALKEKQSAYEAASGDVTSAQTRLEDLLFSLAQQQKQDGKSQALQALELEDMQKQIKEAKEEIETLSGNGSSTEVRSKVSGVVQNIKISAGHTANAGDVLATIEVPDLGYELSASVTNDQARLVHIGDTASVQNYYWGSQIDAELVTIKTDPANPQSGKILTFNVTGDVSNGNELTLSVGQRSSNYDFIVPNSAVRSDTNGSFVLLVNAKSSPLGTRYIATRVDVQVLAKDDKNSAISGALNLNDFVITTSNTPIANGDQIRLPDSN